MFTVGTCAIVATASVSFSCVSRPRHRGGSVLDFYKVSNDSFEVMIDPCGSLAGVGCEEEATARWLVIHERESCRFGVLL